MKVGVVLGGAQEMQRRMSARRGVRKGCTAQRIGAAALGHGKFGIAILYLVSVMPLWTWSFLRDRLFGETAALCPLLRAARPFPRPGTQHPSPTAHPFTWALSHLLQHCIKLKFLSAVGLGKLCFAKAQIVNIFGFLSKEGPLGTLCGYSYNEGK